MVGSKRTGGKGRAWVNIHWTLTRPEGVCAAVASTRLTFQQFGSGLWLWTNKTNGRHWRTWEENNQCMSNKWLKIHGSDNATLYFQCVFTSCMGRRTRSRGRWSFMRRRNEKDQMKKSYWQESSFHTVARFFFFTFFFLFTMTEHRARWVFGWILRFCKRERRKTLRLRILWQIALKSWDT